MDRTNRNVVKIELANLVRSKEKDVPLDIPKQYREFTELF
jgi:hypothetical protein